MSDLRTAAQQALEFIKATNASSSFWLVPESNLNKTVKALRAALEQPEQEQEPVAWMYTLIGGGDIKRDQQDRINWQCRKCGRWADPVPLKEEAAVIDDAIDWRSHD